MKFHSLNFLIFSLFINLTLPLYTLAQLHFEKSYNFNQDAANSTIETYDKGYILTGQSIDSSYVVSLPVVKTDSSGNILWMKRYSNGIFLQASCIIQLVDSSYMITGTLQQDTTGAQDIFLFHIGPTGDSINMHFFNNYLYDQARGMCITQDSGFIITGYSGPASTNNSVLLVIRTNSQGDTLWTRTFGDTLQYTGTSVISTNDKGCAITGRAEISQTDYDVLLLKVDSLGNEQWSKSFGGSYQDQGNCIRQLLDGGFLIGSDSGISNLGGTEAYLIKTDSLGNKIWSESYSYPTIASCIQTNDNNIVAISHTWPVDNEKLAIIKTDSIGNILWTREPQQINGTVFPVSILETSDLNLVIGGIRKIPFTGSSWMYLARFDSAGLLSSVPSSPLINSLNVFPNPGNSFITIQLNDETDEILSIQCIDNEGRLIKSISNNYSDCSIISVAGLSPGVYILTVYTKKQIYKKSLIIR